MERSVALTAVFLALAAYLNAPGAAAQETDDIVGEKSVRLDTPSGLPVPRFASLKSEKTYCRAGPTFEHPVRITFMKKGLPVVIIAETSDHWRKIRDMEGDECWTHKSKLSGVDTALVLADGLALRSRPDPEAPAKAHLGKGLIAKVEAARDGWLKVSAGGMKGWAPESGFWGATPGSVFAAPHN